jgi:hypothetical protein
MAPAACFSGALPFDRAGETASAAVPDETLVRLRQQVLDRGANLRI